MQKTYSTYRGEKVIRAIIYKPKRSNRVHLVLHSSKEYYEARKSMSRINPIFLKSHIAIMEGIMRDEEI